MKDKSTVPVHVENVKRLIQKTSINSTTYYDMMIPINSQIAENKLIQSDLAATKCL